MPAMLNTQLFAAGMVPNQVPATPDHRLQALKVAHDDLDAAIAALSLSGNGDDLTLTRLKKHKLQLKDEMAAILSAAIGHGVARAS
jgi:hypothetical protein